MARRKLEAEGSPKGFKRLVVRAPIYMYRARLGFLMGSRFLLLEHLGRKSGETRRTVLEVVLNQDDAVYVASGWGASAQWLKNIRANPNVRFQLGSKGYAGAAEELAKEQAREVMGRYAANHPKALDKLSHFMLENPGDTAEQQAAAVASEIPIVRLPKG